MSPSRSQMSSDAPGCATASALPSDPPGATVVPSDPPEPAQHPDEDDAAVAALLEMLEEQNKMLAKDQRAVFGSSTAPSAAGSPEPPAEPAAEVQEEAAARSSEAALLLAEWGDMLANWATVAKRKPKVLADLVRRGVPDALRGMVWQNLAQDRAEANASTTLLFSAKRVSGSDDAPSYAELLATESEHARLIKRDIARTFPGHDFFRDKEGLGQEVLFNVIKA